MKFPKFTLLKTKVLDGEFECALCEEVVNEGESFYTSPTERDLDFIDCYCEQCAKNINYKV